MNTAIVLAAGKGSRMNAGMNKQFIELLEKPVIIHTLLAFDRCAKIDRILLVAGQDEMDHIREEILSRHPVKKLDKLVAGGPERQYSVFNALMQLEDPEDIVLIHDGARPMLTAELIEACIAEAERYQAVSAGVPIKETVKVVDDQGFVQYTPKREDIWVTQTPQAFRLGLIKEAHFKANAEGYTGTDDAMLVERMGVPVKMVRAYYENIKLTTREDIITAEVLLGRLSDTSYQDDSRISAEIEVKK